MAVVKYSGLITEFKGKFDNAVFQKCGNSLSVRSNPSRNVARTRFGQISRNQMASVADGWRKLEEFRKVQFYEAAPSYPTFDKFGNPFGMSGFQLYVYLNKTLARMGVPLVSVPTTYNPPNLTGAYLDGYIVDDETMYFDAASPLPAGHRYVLYAAYPFKGYVERNTYNTFFILQHSNTLDASYNFWPIFKAGMRRDIPVGSWLYLELYIIRLSDGQFSLEFAELFEPS